MVENLLRVDNDEKAYVNMKHMQQIQCISYIALEIKPRFYPLRHLLIDSKNN